MLPWFTTTATSSRAVRQCFATRRNIFGQWMIRRGYSNNRTIGDACLGGLRNWYNYKNCCNDVRFSIQKRGFLGCGDGEEGSSMLAKVYEERRVLGYSPEQLFAVVAAVDLYEGFLPWCQRSEIIRRYPDGSFDAELEIGFKLLVESYISHVESTKPSYIKMTNMFFKEVVSRLVGSFNDRCCLIYGPGVQVLENSYEQRA